MKKRANRRSAAVQKKKSSGANAAMSGETAAASKPSAKQRHTFAGRWPIVGLSLASLVLFSLSFPPVGWWPLAYVCLVPWLVGVCITNPAPWVYLVSFVFGALSFLINVHWLYPVTPPGYFALAVYAGLVFPIIALPLRHCVRRRHWSVAGVFGVLWVATEYQRANAVLGFPWLFLAHTQYDVLPMIQISDLVGAHGVSFVVAMVNGWIVDQVIRPTGIWRQFGEARPKRFSRTTVFAGAVLAGTLGYGFYQLNQDTISPGPKAAVLQQDFPSLVSFEDRARQPGELDKAKAYFAMMDEVAGEKPDLVVLPETPWSLYLNREFLEAESFPEADLQTVRYWKAVQKYGIKWNRRFQDYARDNQCSVVVGGVGLDLLPTNVYPNEKKHNSAYVYGPEGGDPERYDKIHLVLFGEYVPFRYGRLHSLYLWLNSITPWGAEGMEYSLTAGDHFRNFSMRAKSQENAVYRFGTPICYEDVLPYIGRGFARNEGNDKGNAGEGDNKQVDFLVNLSNDGWFNHSSELFQHMTICAFRAVENRVGVVRSVNTGVSGFIDPNGKIYDTIGEGETAYRVGRVMVDRRESLYTRWGDWFAIGCCVIGIATLVDAVVVRRFVHWRKPKPEGTS